MLLIQLPFFFRFCSFPVRDVLTFALAQFNFFLLLIVSLNGA